jgi:hypothetical protein
VVDVTTSATPFPITATPSATAGAALEVFGNVVPGDRGTVTLARSGGTATPPIDSTFLETDAGRYTFTAVLTPAGSRTITALGTATQGTSPATVMVDAAGSTARVGQPFDPDVDMLNPAGVEAFFAQIGSTPPLAA